MEICDSHGLAFERSQSGHGHWNLAHPGEGPYGMRQGEDLPEGYQLRVSAPSKNGKRSKPLPEDVSFAVLRAGSLAGKKGGSRGAPASASAAQTEDLREWVSQARLGRELQALEATTGIGGQYEQLRGELSQVKQQLQEQQHQRELQRIEARFDRLESRLLSPQASAPSPSSLERVLEPLVGLLVEWGQLLPSPACARFGGPVPIPQVETSASQIQPESGMYGLVGRARLMLTPALAL